MTEYLKTEIQNMAKRYGEPESIHFTLPTGQFSPLVEDDRDAEVVSAIIRPNGKLITIAKTFYPAGVFRLPTGGIEYGESIESTLHREIHEETNLTVDIIKYIAIVNYTVTDKTRRFFSHIFLVKEVGGELKCNDKKEKISLYKEVNMEELREIIVNLERLEGKFSEWGIFRSLPHKAVLKTLENQ
jgi:ADP-ribose pyrophosphatase YjhB (NUDIX family)